MPVATGSFRGSSCRFDDISRRSPNALYYSHQPRVKIGGLLGDSAEYLTSIGCSAVPILGLNATEWFWWGHIDLPLREQAPNLHAAMRYRT